MGGALIVGTGIDVVEIARIERALERRGERFERRVFAAGEIATCRARGRAGPQFAVRFAAKEAALKAIGTGWAQGARWVDVETVAGGGPGRLALELRGRAAELAARLGAVTPHLAVGRSRTHALAVVLLERRGA